MRVRRESAAKRTPNIRVAKMPVIESAEQAMTPLLKQLAALAIRFGTTPMELADILKLECVRQAAQDATLRNGRVNYSRIAVVTGLTRVEARRLMSSIHANGPTATMPKHRAWRLVSAWMTDMRFLDSEGRPRQLELGRSKDGFGALVRSYCGDVPEKAVLTELQRAGAIRAAKGLVTLRVDSFRKLRRELGLTKAIIQATSDAIGQVATARKGPAPILQSVAIEVQSRADEAVIRQRIHSTLTAAMDAIRSLGERPVTRGTAKRENSPKVLDISAIVTTGIRSPTKKRS